MANICDSEAKEDIIIRDIFIANTCDGENNFNEKWILVLSINFENWYQHQNRI